MTNDVKRARRYDSPRRREQASATRQAILEAAQRLFERQGYSSTSMPAIAEEAGVALKTIYVGFATKATLLQALWAARLGGQEEAIPVFERTWYRKLVEETNAERKLRIVAKQSRVVKSRSGALMEAIRNAAAADSEIAALWNGIQTKLLDVQRSIVVQLDESMALKNELDVAAATDILWTLNHPTVWQLLVRERGWTAEQYEQWLGIILCSQLLRETKSMQ